MKFDKTKGEIVYHTPSFKDGWITVIAEECKANNQRMVLIIPTCKKYSYQINKSFSISTEYLFIYVEIYSSIVLNILINCVWSL